VACGNDGGIGSSQGTLTGSVETVDGSGVANATIQIGDRTIETNEQGWFVVPELEPAERLLVRVSADGMVPTQQVIQVRPGRQTFLDARVFPVGTTATINASEGGEVTQGNARVSIPGGALVTPSGESYSGMAQVSLTAIDPSSRQGRLAAPGDFTGIPQDASEPSELASFGIANFQIRDMEGNELSLADGMNAEIGIPVPEGLPGSPLDEMPLWRYDEEQGRWVEQGTATYDSESDCYVAEVDQPAYWNADQTFDTACVTGQVVRPDGEPARDGITVRAEGTSYIGQSTAWTDSNGRFTVQVRASTSDRSASAQITAQGGGLYTEEPRAIEPTPMQLASSGNCMDIGEMELAYPLASIALTWGESPSDLDSHFTGPEAEGDGRFHVAFDQKDVGQAFLDTDDTSSFGPEVTSLLDDVPGTYVYAVHNYSGESSGPIRQSGATVQAFMPNEFRSFEVQNASGTPDGEDAVWRVFQFEVDSNGNVGSIQPINEIVTGDTEDSYKPE
jgi:hypothetical protein